MTTTAHIAPPPSDVPDPSLVAHMARQADRIGAHERALRGLFS
jgi:hypothetical protein